MKFSGPELYILHFYIFNLVHGFNHAVYFFYKVDFLILKIIYHLVLGIRYRLNIIICEEPVIPVCKCIRSSGKLMQDHIGEMINNIKSPEYHVSRS